MRQILIEKYIFPSEIKKLGFFVVEYWFNKYGELHSFMSQPASNWYNYNGKLIYQNWYKKHERHRDGDLPAYINYHYNGIIKRQYWFKKDEIHRNGDFPSEMYYNKNGKIIKEVWRRNEKILKQQIY
jgi:hypothetical protein